MKLGKKKRLRGKNEVTYEPRDLWPIAEALKAAAKELERKEEKLSSEKLPSMEVNLEGLYEAIQLLPRGDREILEVYWGLTGKTNHSKRKVTSKDTALKNMIQETSAVIYKMLTIDYLYLFDESSKGLMKTILTKVDRSNTQLSDQDVIKYLMNFIVFFINGPKMAFEDNDNELDQCPEEHILYEYAMIQSIWLDFAYRLPPESINLKLLVEAVEVFNWKDVVTIRNFSNLHVDKKDRPTEVKTVGTLGEVRRFKEAMFAYGEWEVTTLLIMRDPKWEVHLQGFTEELANLRGDFDRVFDYAEDMKTIMTSKGKRTLTVYKIGGLQFTDPEEVIFLYGVLS